MNKTWLDKHENEADEVWTIFAAKPFHEIQSFQVKQQ